MFCLCNTPLFIINYDRSALQQVVSPGSKLKSVS